MRFRSRKKYRDLFLDRSLKNNLVLAEGIGVCPLIGGATTLKTGVAMFVCAVFTLVLTSLFMRGIGKKLPSLLRLPVHALTASILLCGEAYLINEAISTELFASLYLFLPLLAVTTLFAYHGDNVVSDFDSFAGFVDAFASALGFGGVLCLVGAVREIAAKRTLWDIPLPLTVDLPQASLPFAAFLLLGMLAALLQHSKKVVADRNARQQDPLGGDSRE